MLYNKQHFIAQKDSKISLSSVFDITAEAPSNIALVKYWGKYAQQLPMNPSISFSLNKSKTITSIKFKKLEKPQDSVSFQFYFEGKHKPDFEPKIKQFFENVLLYIPFLKYFKLQIDSHNTFPHSSGIASSASAFAALSKILTALEKKLFPNTPIELLQKKASFLARLGSGSASRSTAHPVMLWGTHPKISNTANLYAIQPQIELHSIFKNFQDTIVLVEEGQKAVSSTAGHQLMENHLYKDLRKQQAFENVLKMYQILQTGDINAFITLVEQEALTLHALMMTSQPNYILMQPETLHIIQNIRQFRKETNAKVCFTLDAGANVHVLYPESEKTKVQKFLKDISVKKMIFDFITCL